MEYTYDLVSICNHHSEETGQGHYTATILTNNNEWY